MGGGVDPKENQEWVAMQPPQGEAITDSAGQAWLVSSDERRTAASTNKEDSAECGNSVPQPHQNFPICPHFNFRNPIPC